MAKPPNIDEAAPYDLKWSPSYCPFMDEDRPPHEIHPCPERYRAGCGCKKNHIPSPGRRYRRTAG